MYNQNLNSSRCILIIVLLIGICNIPQLSAQNISLNKSYIRYGIVGNMFFESGDFQMNNNETYLMDSRDGNQIIHSTLKDGKMIRALNSSRTFESTLDIKFVDTNNDNKKELYVFTQDSVFHLSVPNLQVIESYELFSTTSNYYRPLFSDLNNDGTGLWRLFINNSDNNLKILDRNFNPIENKTITLPYFDEVYSKNVHPSQNKELIFVGPDINILSSDNYEKLATYYLDYEEQFGFIKSTSDYSYIAYLSENDNVIIEDSYIDSTIYRTPQSIRSELFILDYNNDGIQDLIHDKCTYCDKSVVIDGNSLDTITIINKIPDDFTRGETIAINDKTIFSGNDATITLYDLNTSSYKIITKDFLPDTYITTGRFSQSSLNEILFATNRNNYQSFDYENFSYNLKDLNSYITGYSRIRNVFGSIPSPSKSYDYIVGKTNDNFLFQHSYQNNSIFNFNNTSLAPNNSAGIYDLYRNGKSYLIDLDNYGISIYEINDTIQSHKIKSFESLNVGGLDFSSIFVENIDNDVTLEILFNDSNNNLIIIDPDNWEIESTTFDHNRILSSYKCNDSLYFFTQDLDYINIYNYTGDYVSTRIHRDSLDNSSFSHKYITSTAVYINGECTPLHVYTGENREIFFYDENFNLQASRENVTEPYTREPVLHNLDKDDKLNFIMYGDYIIKDYELDIESAQRNSFYVTKSFPQQSQEYQINEDVRILFSEEIPSNNLHDFISVIQEGKELEYDYSIDDSYCLILDIKEEQLNKTIEVHIDFDLKSKSGHYFDGNKDNTVSLDETDNYTLTYTPIQNHDSNLEIIFNRYVPDTVVRNTITKLDFNIVDHTGTYLINTVIAGLSDDILNGNGQSLRTIDAKNDSYSETYHSTLNAFTTEDSIKYSIVAQVSDEVAETVSFTVQVKDSVEIKFEKSGVDQYNSNFINNEQSKIYYRKSWEIDTSTFRDNLVVGTEDRAFQFYNNGFDDSLNIVAYKLNTGSKIYSKPILDSVSSYSYPIYNKGFIYIFSSESNINSYLSCIDSYSGNILWETPLSDYFINKHSPTISGKYLVLSTGDYRFFVFNRWTGEMLWTDQIDGNHDPEPVISENIMIISSDNIIKSYSLETGRLINKAQTDDHTSFLNTNLIDTTTQTFIKTYKDSISVYSIDSLDHLWTYTLEAPFSNFNRTAASTHGKLYISTNSDTLYVFNCENGEILEKTKLLSTSLNKDMFTTKNDLLYYPSEDSFYIYSLDSFSLVNKFQINESTNTTSVLGDYLVFSGDNKLLSVYEGSDRCLIDKYINKSFCKNDSITLFDKVYTQAGNYLDTISYNNCDTIYNIELEYFPDITICDTIIQSDNGNNTGFISVDVCGGSGGYSYQWSNGGNSAINNNLKSGTYSLTVTDAEGCESTFEFTVNESTSTSAPHRELIITPNPFSSFFTIKSNNIQVHKYKLLNSNGTILRNGILDPDNNNKINTVNLPSGTYFIVINNEWILQVIKQ